MKRRSCVVVAMMVGLAPVGSTRAESNGPAPLPATTPREPPFVRLAVQTEAAVGVSGRFYNHLVGGRADLCAAHASTTCLGAYLGYANLKGQDGRAHSVLGYVLLDHRIALRGIVSLPIRLGTGWLAKNGPFLRTSAGLGLELRPGVALTLDLLAPTLWVTGKQPVYSLDFGAELAFAL